MQPPDEPAGHAAECTDPHCLECIELIDEALESLEADLGLPSSPLGESGSGVGEGRDV